MRRLLPLLLLALTACGTVKVAELDLPEGAWTVEGSNPRVWNRPIGFGPFRTQSVNEGSTRSWVVDAGILSAGRLERGTRLSIAGVEVECHTRQLLVGVSEVYVDPALGRSALLLCGMTQRDGRHSLLTLSRTGTSDAWLTGELRSPKADPLTIRSLHLAKGRVSSRATRSASRSPGTARASG
jgi:hypothetical protein